MGKYAQIAQGCRMVALEMVHKAGKGHLGTSFSSADIIVAMRSLMGKDDIFLSSKGHDSPMQYAVLAAWNLLPAERLNTLRTEGGLPGHPTVDVPGIAANTGSLGMGLSKACGFVWAHRLRLAGPLVFPESYKHRRVFVLMGDGECHEGQVWEAALFAARHNMGEILVAVDANRWQQDGPASMSPDRIAKMFQACGWAVEMAEGNADVLRLVFTRHGNMPRCVVVETRKGEGVSFMIEDPAKWHQHGPSDEEYHRALEELGG
jgi:transketolase